MNDQITIADPWPTPDEVAALKDEILRVVAEKGHHAGVFVGLAATSPVFAEAMRDPRLLDALEPLDGATVKRVIDGSGRTPLPPQVAYQQVIKGVPALKDWLSRAVLNPVIWETRLIPDDQAGISAAPAPTLPTVPATDPATTESPTTEPPSTALFQVRPDCFSAGE